jgi:hypothetical protein
MRKVSTVEARLNFVKMTSIHNANLASGSEHLIVYTGRLWPEPYTLTNVAAS